MAQEKEAGELWYSEDVVAFARRLDIELPVEVAAHRRHKRADEDPLHLGPARGSQLPILFPTEGGNRMSERINELVDASIEADFKLVDIATQWAVAHQPLVEDMAGEGCVLSEEFLEAMTAWALANKELEDARTDHEFEKIVEGVSNE